MSDKNKNLKMITDQICSSDCLLNKDRNAEIFSDRNFVEEITDIFVAYEYHRPNPISLEADFLLAQGIALNSLLLHKEAIEALTQSINLKRYNKQALIERALAYFEIDKIELALDDYERIKKLSLPPFIMGDPLLYNAEIYIPDEKMEFTQGFVAGVVSGGAVSAIEVIPSIFSSLRGITKGLWAFACSPLEVSGELITSAYELGQLISTLSKTEILECVIPEIRELSQSWGTINDRERGKKIGYIFGKYGCDIFIPCGFVKGAGKIKALKTANTKFTLESCQSKIKKTKILQESKKHSLLRDKTLAEAAKSQKIIVKNANVKYHIMQKKHSWDKVIELTGNVETDFAKVVALLEENCMIDKSHLTAKPLLFPEYAPKIKKSYHQITINNLLIEAEFETYLQTGEIFLQNAWVVIK